MLLKFTKIWVGMYRFSKMAHFIPLGKNAKTVDLVTVFLKEL